MGDNTAYIQAQIDTGKKIPGGVYMIDATKSVKVTKPGVIDLSGVTLKAIPNGETGYKILHIQASNVTVKGGLILGERKEHKGTTGEWGHGIRVGDKNCPTNIVLEKVTVRDCWGDGLYVAKAKNVKILNCLANNNRRQGLSVIEVDGLLVKDSTFSETNGTLPQDGIDLEPDRDCVIKNVTIQNCKFIRNKGAGVEIAGKRGKVTKVEVKDCTFTGNKPTKVGGVANESKYQPSLLAKARSYLGDWTGWPTTISIP